MGFSATRQLSLCRQGDNINCGTVTLSTLLNCVSPENTIAYDEKDPYLCRVHLFNLTARFCIQRTDTASPSLFPLPQLPPGVMTRFRTVVKEPIYIDDSSPKKPSHQSTAATPSTSGQPCFPLIAAPEKSKKREHAETSETDTNIDKKRQATWNGFTRTGPSDSPTDTTTTEIMIVPNFTKSTPRLSASSKGMTQSKTSSSAFFKTSKVYGQPVKSPERSSSLVESIYNPGFHHYLPLTIRPPAHHCQLHRLLGNEAGQRLQLALLVHLLAAGRSTPPTELTNGPINALANCSVLYTYNADRTTARWQLDVPTWVITTYGMSISSSTYARFSE